MSYTVGWLVPQCVVMVAYHGEVNAEVATEVAQALVEHYEQGIAPVHTLVDQSKVTGTSSSPVKMIQAFSPIFNHPNSGWLLFFGSQNAFIAFMATVIAQTAGIKYKYMKNQSEALAFLKEVDSRITDEVMPD